jgi:hypothetical protein
MPTITILITYLAPAVVGFFVALVIKRGHARFANPLTKSMRRPPGTELGRQLGAEQLEVGFTFAEILFPAAIPIAVAAVLQPRYEEGGFSWLLGLVLIIWAGWVSLLHP